MEAGNEEKFFAVGTVDDHHSIEDAPIATYKSWKKKYRKMRAKFEEKMSVSDIQYKQEQEAAEVARRLTLENDGILDMLLDVNHCNQIPKHLRIDLGMDNLPHINYLPSPISPTEANGSDGQQKYEAVAAHINNLISEKLANKPSKSLSSLMSSTPHRPFTITAPLSKPLVSMFPGIIAQIADDLEHEEPASYISPDQLDEHIANIDASLGLPTIPALRNPSYQPTPSHLSDKDLQVRNPVSVYNWLREHEPKVFLQDGETQALSEKSLVKPGALRGAGKRSSIPAPSKADAVEFVEEDGLGYDVSLGGTAASKDVKGIGKRKRASDEDAGYRPKGGVSRPIKKKKKEGSGESTSSGRSSGGKGKGRAVKDIDAVTTAGGLRTAHPSSPLGMKGRRTSDSSNPNMG